MTDPCLPNLGCATTRELLAEIDARMRVAASSERSMSNRFNMSDVASTCRVAQMTLAPEVLNYRTVDS